MPIYNVEKFLCQCINSLLSQTYKNTEIILVNDGSTDDSGKICEFYASKHSNIIYISKQNGGVASARNAGLERSTGEFVTFIDSDDWIEDIFLEHLYDIIQKNNCDIAIARSVWQKPTTKKIKHKKSEKTIVLSVEETLKEFLLFNNFCWATWSKLFKRSVIQNVRYPETCFYGEDGWFVCEAVKNAQKIAYSDKIIYHYIKHSSGITFSRFSEKYLTIYDFLDFQQQHPNQEIKTYFRAWRFMVSIEIYYKLIRAHLLKTDHAKLVWQNLQENYKSFKHIKKFYKIKNFRKYLGLAYFLMKIFYRYKAPKTKK